MSEAASHIEAAERRRDEAIADFETPQAVALSCSNKNADQIHSMLLAVAGVVAISKGFEKDGSYADMRALRYASEAIEWLWKRSEVLNLD